jgi:hypothetical protein
MAFHRRTKVGVHAPELSLAGYLLKANNHADLKNHSLAFVKKLYGARYANYGADALIGSALTATPLVTPPPTPASPDVVVVLRNCAFKLR